MLLFLKPHRAIYSHPYTVESQSQGLTKLAVTLSVLEITCMCGLVPLAFDSGDALRELVC